MATQTTNLNLTLPDGTDQVDVSVLNENFQKIDDNAGGGAAVRVQYFTFTTGASSGMSTYVIPNIPEGYTPISVFENNYGMNVYKSGLWLQVPSTPENPPRVAVYTTSGTITWNIGVVFMKVQ